MAQAPEITAVRAPGELLPAREVELRKAVRIGLLGGVAAVFIGLSGMVQTFDVRPIVYPLLSLSYVVLFAAPFAAGYVAATPPPVLEGFAATRPGRRNILAGLIAGALSGLVLAVFLVLIHTFDVSSILIKITATAKDLLTLGRGLGIGIALMVLAMAGVGTAGGAVHLLSRKWRRAVLYSVFWVLVFGLIQVIVGQIQLFRSFPFLLDFLYSVVGGLSIRGALVVFLLVFAIVFFLDQPIRDVRARVAGKDEATRKRNRRRTILIALIAAVPLLILLPNWLGPFVAEVFDLAGIFLLMALGLNIVVGFAGLLDLGYVAFFAVGAYTAAVLTSPASPTLTPELTFWLAIPFILLAAAFSGILVGTPVLRMRGDYLAIVTLGFGEIARILFLSDALKPWFGGAQGLLVVPDIPLLGTSIDDAVSFFPIIYLFAILFAYISYALQESRIGRAWIAMREDEPVAEVMGVNITAAKLRAFVIGAMFAGIGGALFAHKIGSVFPESFAILVSITVLVLIIVGGMASVPGVVVGALILVGLPELLREFQEFKFLFYGVLLIFMMLKRPEGFIPSRRRAKELHEEEAVQDAWLGGQQATADAGAGAQTGGVVVDGAP
ncbi:MAG TPA: leucine/isoleucine/valine transporter permease subunit [Acidimicrobiia bacterium]